jgi:hypothetical protein
MANVIRFANEGFVNYNQNIKVDNNDIDTEGCYVFINKVIKKALRYDRSMKKRCEELGVRNRDKDVKNIGTISEDTYVYARIINANELYVVESCNEISIQPEGIGTKIDVDNFKRIKISELVENLKEYEALEKRLRKTARDKGLRLSYFNSPYLYYEAIVNANDINV